MDCNKTLEHVQLFLEAGDVVSFADTAFSIHAAEVPDFSLNVADLHVRLRLIRWFGRLLELMTAWLRDRPVQFWRKYCHRKAEEEGMDLGEEFLA